MLKSWMRFVWPAVALVAMATQHVVCAQVDPDPTRPDLVPIPAGQFVMGVGPAEELREGVPLNLRHLAEPRHRVEIVQSFGLAKYLVTRAEFAAFVRDSEYRPPKGCFTILNGKTRVNSPLYDWENPGFLQTDRDPVICVNYADAEAYVTWLSKRTGDHYRLPTEAEWEYAVRAGTTTARYWGDDRDGEREHSNIADLSLRRVLKSDTASNGYVPWDDGFPFTSPVGTFRPNPFGLFDMLGNVWEWVDDCWNGNYMGAPSDGSAWKSGDCSRRVLRGASWGNFPNAARSGLRGSSDIGIRSAYYGFRVAGPYHTPIS